MSKTEISPKGQHTWSTRQFALSLALITPIIHAYLRLFGYRRTLKLLCRLIPTRSTTASPGDPESFAGIMRRLVRLARDRNPLPGSCLSRSLALWWLLRWQGIETTLNIGARRDSPSFQAHAWLEFQDHPLNAGKRVRQRYAAFDKVFTPEVLLN